ncbi:MAG: hypothetical protein QMD77_03905 [Patescibacteria group bacterium]|nr:hypothetical protein [Patescibacteria group bacterium]
MNIGSSACSLIVVLIVTFCLFFVPFVLGQVNGQIQKPQNFQALEDHHLRVNPTGNSEIYCCGVIVGSQLYLVNKHVLKDMDKFAKGKFSILKKGHEEDLALIQANRENVMKSGRPLWLKIARQLSVGGNCISDKPQKEKESVGKRSGYKNIPGFCLR